MLDAVQIRQSTLQECEKIEVNSIKFKKRCINLANMDCFAHQEKI